MLKIDICILDQVGEARVLGAENKPSKPVEDFRIVGVTSRGPSKTAYMK